MGINTTSPASGALLDIFASDKGVLLPRVALTGTNDTSTITPGLTVGLMIYNTVTAGSSPNEVTPGFYYWNGLQWSRLFDQGYTLHYEQGNQTQLSIFSSTYTTVDGLDSGIIPIVVPYSGTYQIIVQTNYSTGNISNTSSDAASEASVQLRMQTGILGPWTTLAEKYVFSSSKRILTTSVNNLGQEMTIIENVELDASEVYRFQVRAREWRRVNASSTGYIGQNSNGMSGASGVNTAKRGSMSIAFIKEN